MPSLNVRTGTRLLDYRIEAVLGRGGMSVVYLAEDLRLRRKVALKLLAAELAEDERFRERFLRESELAASIDHPNVVPIYDAGEAEGLLYIAMRYVAGTDLKVLLRRAGALDPVRALAIVSQVAKALDVAHEQGLVHRDVKPANVLLATQGGGEHAYLGDFGLTKSASISRGLTRADQFFGTIDYVAPEQIRGESVDRRADVYSLGCLLFECLTGEVPFHREAEVAVIYAHLREKPPTASERHAGLSVELDRVLARAMAKKPADRFVSCGELVAAAQAALGGTRETAFADRFGERRRALLLLAGSLGTLGLAAGLVYALSGGGSSNVVSAVAGPGKYRVTLSEQLTTGRGGAVPGLALSAAFDNGHGLRGFGTAPAAQTAVVVFHVDRSGVSNVFSLLSSPSGTPIGYFSADPGGGDHVQSLLRKTGLRVDGRTGDRVIQLAQEVSPAFRQLSGQPTLPLTLRVSRTELVFTADLQRVAQRAAALGVEFSYAWIGIRLFPSYRRLGEVVPAAANPTHSQSFRISVSARPCADQACKALGPAAHDSGTIVLPRRITVLAPRRALYGRPVRFRGLGRPGDYVTVAYERRPGSGASCTTANFERPPDCAPRFVPYLRKITERHSRVTRDGTWSLSLPLTAGVPVGGPYEKPRERSASGRYVAIAYTGRQLWGPLLGGTFSVVAQPATATVVALAKPTIKLSRRTGKLRVIVSLKGADRFVRLELLFRGAIVARGRLGDRGRFTTDLPLPRRSGILEVRSSAPGTTPSRAFVEIAPATA
jgi:serine/threonine-protein kinase